MDSNDILMLGTWAVVVMAVLSLFTLKTYYWKRERDLDKQVISQRKKIKDLKGKSYQELTDGSTTMRSFDGKNWYYVRIVVDAHGNGEEEVTIMGSATESGVENFRKRVESLDSKSN